MLVNSSSSSSSHSCSWEWDRCVTPEWPRRTAHLHRSAGKRRLLSERIRSNHLLLGRPGRRFHVRSNSYLLVTKHRHSTRRCVEQYISVSLWVACRCQDATERRSQELAERRRSRSQSRWIELSWWRRRRHAQLPPRRQAQPRRYQ